jgi:DNA-directed RNA polymerase specialized sigma24 family protein
MTPRGQLILEIQKIAQRHRVSWRSVFGSAERTADTVAARQEVCVLLAGRGVPPARIARFLGVWHTTVHAALKRAEATGTGKIAA